MAFYRCGSGGGTKFPILFSISAYIEISATALRALLYSDSQNKTYRNYQMNSRSGAGMNHITFTGSDFSGSISAYSGDISITVKQAGDYLINDAGAVTTQHFNVNDTVTVKVYGHNESLYWYMVKI